MKIVSIYYRLLDNIYQRLTKTIIGSFIFGICFVIGVFSPFILTNLSYAWAKILSIIFSCIVLSVLFTAVVMDTFGQVEMKTESEFAPKGGIGDLRKHYGNPGIVSYIFFAILLISIYYTIIYSSLDSLSISKHFDNPHPTNRAIDFFLYSLVTVFLLGYGDITPISAIAKIISISETVFALFVLVVLITRALSDN